MLTIWGMVAWDPLPRHKGITETVEVAALQKMSNMIKNLLQAIVDLLQPTSNQWRTWQSPAQPQKWSRPKVSTVPWIPQGIISSIKHRDYLLRVYKRSKLLTDFETYKQFQNRLTHFKDLAKRKYYEEHFAQNSTNSKRTWKLINDIFGKTNHLVFLKD